AAMGPAAGRESRHEHHRRPGVRPADPRPHPLGLGRGRPRLRRTSRGRSPRPPPGHRGDPNSGPPICRPTDRLPEERCDLHDFLKPLHELLPEYDRPLAYTADLWRDLDPDEVVWRPHQDSSAIGWHLGHQAHVAHIMVRNLTAAEPSPDPDLDGIMDSANPEQFRGTLPTIDRLRSFRSTVAERVHDRVGAIAAGNVAAPDQLTMIAGTMLTAIINHEYQHDQWISEVRSQSLGHALPD